MLAAAVTDITTMTSAAYWILLKMFQQRKKHSQSLWDKKELGMLVGKM